MLSVEKIRQALQGRKLKKKRLILIGIVVVLIVFVGATILIVKKNNEDAAKRAAKEKSKVTFVMPKPATKYTFQSADVSCKNLKPYDAATYTVNYCSGKLTVTDPKTKKSNGFAISQSTHFYINGVEQDLTKLPELEKGKSNLVLGFYSFKGQDRILEKINATQ